MLKLPISFPNSVFNSFKPEMRKLNEKIKLRQQDIIFNKTCLASVEEAQHEREDDEADCSEIYNTPARAFAASGFLALKLLTRL